MIERLTEAVLAGKTWAVAKAITMAEIEDEQAAQLVCELRPSARGGHLVGVTGAPGAGKSTLISKLAKEFRSSGKTVGVIAVDPSSPFSGGSILGDRVRMQELAGDPGVFVRSMASGGRAGGLASAVEDAAVILRAAGKDVVLVETVGVGQGELDVASVAQTVVVVLTPGMGDEVQSLKAGLMEVADIFVVNKADLAGADAVARSLHAIVNQPGTGWTRPVVQTSMFSGAGVSDLADAVDKHKEYLGRDRSASELDVKLNSKRILSLAGQQILAELESTLDPGRLEQLAAGLAAGTLEPREAAQEAVRLFFSARLTAARSGELQVAAGVRAREPLSVVSYIRGKNGK